jgi:hypothetical protein
LVLAVQVDTPMLDEQEFAEIASLHRLGMQSVKEYRVQTGVPFKDVPLMRWCSQGSLEVLLTYSTVRVMDFVTP